MAVEQAVDGVGRLGPLSEVEQTRPTLDVASGDLLCMPPLDLNGDPLTIRVDPAQINIEPPRNASNPVADPGPQEVARSSK